VAGHCGKSSIFQFNRGLLKMRWLSIKVLKPRKRLVKEEKLLTIRLYKHGKDRIRIEVADNGVGIPREDLTKIFDLGFTTKQDGHGFGLHSSALAAQEMGGSLTVNSDGLGKGTTFTLELPFTPVNVRK
jgi:signal transduction histidine kinase